MEAVERAQHAFQSWKISQFLYNCFGCISQSWRAKLFRGRWLKVDRPVEPELLIWENFGVTTGSRFMRIVSYLIFIIVVLVGCLFMVSWLNMKSNEVAEKIPNVLCPESVDPYAANLDYTEGTETNEKEKFHCFCKNLLSK